MIVSDSAVPEELASGAKQALAAIGDMVDSGAYVAAARGQRLSPTSDAALTRIGPKVRVKLIVSLEIARNGLLVAFRDGSTGQTINEAKLPSGGNRPKFSARAGKRLTTAAKRALSKLGGPAVNEPEERDDLDDDDDSPAPPPPPAPAPPKRTAPPPQAAAEASASAPWNEQAAAEEQEEDKPAEESEAAGGQSSGAREPLRLRASLGGGAGARGLTVPTRNGGAPADTGFSFPALSISAGVEATLGTQILIGGEIAYRTIFGLNGLYAEADSSTTLIALSSHNLSGGATLGYRFGPPGSSDLRVVLGWAYRSLTAADPILPSDSIHGPLLRPELRIPIAGGVLTLRLAPELIVVIGSSTKLLGNVDGLASAGVAIGGEVSLDVRLASAISLGVEYRESHAFVSSGWGNNLLDMERYAQGRVTVNF